jgi:hypothetical protein
MMLSVGDGIARVYGLSRGRLPIDSFLQQERMKALGLSSLDHVIEAITNDYGGYDKICFCGSYIIGIALRKTPDAVEGQLTERKAGRPPAYYCTQKTWLV